MLLLRKDQTMARKIIIGRPNLRAAAAAAAEVIPAPTTKGTPEAVI
jgi:hypothetical protein